MSLNVGLKDLEHRLRDILVRLSSDIESLESLPNNVQVAIKRLLSGTVSPSFKNDPKVEEEIVNSLLNIIILADQLGINLEEKAVEYIEQLEGTTLYAA